MRAFLRKSLFTRSFSALVFAAPCILSTSGAGAGQFDLDRTPPEQQPALQIEEYWTKARMNSATPMDFPEVIATSVTTQNIDIVPAGEAPGFMPGWSGRGPQPTANDAVTLKIPENPTFGAPQHGTIPTTNPRLGPYGPFQRWTLFGRYLSYPRSIHGKLFFSLGASNFVCSATVMGGKNMLITAGHCNSSGNGQFATNRLFCPSYNKNGVNPAVGCWAVVNSKTSDGWHFSGDPDYDYACLITNTTGTVHNNSIGNITGWAGYAWNFPQGQPTMQFGYPAASPFPGYHIITAATTEWYTFDFTPGAQVSKFIGSDMTGGSSGGSWLLSWNHPNAEYADSDGLSATDPVNTGGPHVNGVNSHKRCRINCNSPPSDTAGVYWQEMSSPPFLNTAATDESTDIIQVCTDNGGT